MPRPVTAEQVALSRAVSTEAVLQNLVDLRGYPYRHLAVIAPARFSGTTTTELLTAVEYLSQFGWELVSVAGSPDTSSLKAFLRRR